MLLQTGARREEIQCRLDKTEKTKSCGLVNVKLDLSRYHMSRPPPPGGVVGGLMDVEAELYVTS